MCWQQQLSSLRTDEVTGPHHSPVNEGGHFIDKETSVCAKQMSVTSLCLSVRRYLLQPALHCAANFCTELSHVAA